MSVGRLAPKHSLNIDGIRAISKNVTPKLIKNDVILIDRLRGQDGNFPRGIQADVIKSARHHGKTVMTFLSGNSARCEKPLKTDFKARFCFKIPDSVIQSPKKSDLREYIVSNNVEKHNILLRVIYFDKK